MTARPCCFLLPLQRRKHSYCWGDGEEIWQERRPGPAAGAETRLVTLLDCCCGYYLLPVVEGLCVNQGQNQEFFLP
ncbi:hypothetical protein NC652_016726 [Populus alba x Populus x berolinensis]|nr:hypothetical protein NC652_016726 [Populus alba x Populus x berolinensis]